MAITWCPVCGNSLTGRKTYCTNACRQRAYRDSRLPPIIVMSGSDEERRISAGESTCDAPSDRNANRLTGAPTVSKRNTDVLLYRALQEALHKHAATGGTAVGTLQIVQRVFLSMGYDGMTYRAPLPRLNRAEREALGVYNAQKLTDAAVRAAWLQGYEQGLAKAQAAT